MECHAAVRPAKCNALIQVEVMDSKFDDVNWVYSQIAKNFHHLYFIHERIISFQNFLNNMINARNFELSKCDLET